jgi:VWFA-related protein
LNLRPQNPRTPEPQPKNPDLITMRAAGFLVVVASLLFLRAGPIGLVRQTPQSPQSTFRAGVDIVALDVSVLDKNRRPVRGLTAADFTILEGGKPRPIVNFEAIELPMAAKEGAAWTHDVAPDVVSNDPSDGRLMVIMFDAAIGPGWPTVAARKIANAAIDQLGPGDLAAVIFTQDLQRPQNFTADRAKLRYATESRGIGIAQMGPGRCLCGVCSLDAIKHVADVLREVTRRQKTLFFIGHAIAVDVQPTPGPDDCAQFTQRATAEMFEAAQRANVVIHAFDPAGVTPPAAFSAQARASAPTAGKPPSIASLQILAERTGGRAVFNDNQPGDVVPQIFSETATYYLIGFQASDQKSATDFHAIDVRVNRRDAVVHTRPGYYAPSFFTTSSKARPAPALSPLESAQQGQLPKSDIPLHVTIAPFGVPGKTDAALAIVMALNPTQALGGRVHVLTTAYDRDGNALGSQQHTIDVAMSGASNKYELISRIDLRPGHYEIRMAAQDETSGRIASVYTYADVPKFFDTALSMSGVVLEATPSLGAAPKDALSAILPVIPTAARSFSASSRVRGSTRPIGACSSNRRRSERIASSRIAPPITCSTCQLRASRPVSIC